MADYTEDDLAAIRSAIAKGARSVQMNGERVEFRDLSKMLEIERKIMEDLGLASSGRIQVPTTKSGWR